MHLGTHSLTSWRMVRMDVGVVNIPHTSYSSTMRKNDPASGVPVAFPCCMKHEKRMKNNLPGKRNSTKSVLRKLPTDSDGEVAHNRCRNDLRHDNKIKTRQ